MSEQNDIKKELESLNSPMLAAWQGKAKEWSVPNDLLEEMTQKVIEQEQQKTAKRISLVSRYVWQIAAAIALLIAGAWIGSMLNSNTADTALASAPLQDLSTKEVENYIINHIDDFDWALLEEQSATLAPESMYEFDLEDDEIDEDWLSDDDFDLF